MGGLQRLQQPFSCQQRRQQQAVLQREPHRRQWQLAVSLQYGASEGAGLPQLPAPKQQLPRCHQQQMGVRILQQGGRAGADLRLRLAQARQQQHARRVWRLRLGLGSEGRLRRQLLWLRVAVAVGAALVQRPQQMQTVMGPSRRAARAGGRHRVADVSGNLVSDVVVCIVSVMHSYLAVRPVADL